MFIFVNFTNMHSTEPSLRIGFIDLVQASEMEVKLSPLTCSMSLRVTFLISF